MSFFQKLPRPASDAASSSLTGRLGEPGAAYLMAKMKVQEMTDAQVLAHKQDAMFGPAPAAAAPAPSGEGATQRVAPRVAEFNDPSASMRNLTPRA